MPRVAGRGLPTLGAAIRRFRPVELFPFRLIGMGLYLFVLTRFLHAKTLYNAMTAADPSALRKAPCSRDLDWRGPASVISVCSSRLKTSPQLECPTTCCLAPRGLCMTGFDRSFGASRSSRHSSSAPCLRYQACWFEPTRPQLAGRMWFLLPFVAVNNRPSAAFCFALGPPDSSGRGFCARFSTLSGMRWSIARCWFKPTPARRGRVSPRSWRPTAQ